MAMRMGPFSVPQVVTYINQNFVPIFVSNEDYRDGRRGDHEDRLLRTIRKKAQAKGLSGGAVQVYLLSSVGEVIDVMHVARASQLRELMPWLRKVTKAESVVPGKALIAPKSTLQMPSISTKEVALHFRAQYIDRETATVDDWVVLKKEEWEQFLQPPGATDAKQWALGEDLSTRILMRFYPYAADWSLDVEGVESAEIRVRRMNKQATLALEGTIRRLQNRYPGHSPQQVNLDVVGIVEPMDSGPPKITMTTFRAKYGRRRFEGVMQTYFKDSDE